MKPSALSLLAAGLGLWASLASARPRFYTPRQRLIDGHPLRTNFAGKDPWPYTPEHRDPYDSKVDPIDDDLDPLPWRNGLGASILGPYNRDRSRQSPDMVRPPGTDHGSIPNMRWSFTDSHVRIEV